MTRYVATTLPSRTAGLISLMHWKPSSAAVTVENTPGVMKKYVHERTVPAAWAALGYPATARR